MMKKGVQFTLPVLLGGVAVFLLGCAGPRETYLLLPDSKGQVGTVMVTPKAGQPVSLEGAYAHALGQGGHASNAGALTPQGVQQTFGEALAAKPEAPLRFTLYFKEGSDELTGDSKKDLENVLAEVRKRPAPDVIVVGHTDRVGQLQDNDRLALRRAEKMRQELLRQGLPEDSVQAAGRGEREPLIPTADEVAEPRNRRVEMLVR